MIIKVFETTEDNVLVDIEFHFEIDGDEPYKGNFSIGNTDTALLALDGKTDEEKREFAKKEADKKIKEIEAEMAVEKPILPKKDKKDVTANYK